jgi:hypothetical protein
VSKGQRNTLEIVLDRVDRHGPGGCWLWTGTKTGDGYGSVGFEAVTWRVHRLVYVNLVGPIPEGLQLDHLCRVRHCCNPEHLEAVTGQENQRRGLRNQKSSLTHCPQGHEYSPANTYVAPRTGARACRTCRKGHQDRYRSRNHRKPCPVCSKEVNGSSLRQHIRAMHETATIEKAAHHA